MDMRQGAGSSRMLPQLLPRSRFLPHSIILCAAVRVNPVRQLTFCCVCTTIILREYPEKCFALRRKEYHGRTERETERKKEALRASLIYAIGIVWLLYAGKLNTFRGILSCAVVSAIVYAILRIVLPGKKTDEPPKAAAPEQPQPKQAEKKPEPQPEPEPEEKLPPELQSVIYQGKRAIADIRRLNDEIPDERISAQIDLIERLTAQIFDCVRKNPKKLSQIRQFLNYYLPTTIKLMEQYVTLQNQSLKTENITEGMQKIEDLLDKVIIAFQRQLDALFEADVVDITADIRVMEQMMASEGLTNKKDFA